MSMRKVCAACLTALFAAGTATALQAADAAKTAPSTFKPGTYTATVNGHNAPVTVKVTVSKNRIEKIDTSKNLETIGVGRVALKLMTDKILKYQSLGVDAITGASISSLALLSGVEKCLEQAGGNIDKLTEQVEKHPAGTKTYDADVVVIGGGGSGLATAIAAYQAGAKKVIVVEKLGYLGGSTNVSEGALNAVDPKRQGKQGIEDSFEKFYDQTMKGGHNKGNPELVKYLTQNSMKSVEWLESMGVKFKDEIGTATGALWQRSHYPATPSGNTYIRSFEQVIKGTNGAIQVLTDTQATDLLQDKGRITGVTAKHFGQQVILNAKDGVWSVVLYNAGIGTGSGWYFYKVPVKTPTAIDAAQQVAPKGRLYDGHLTLTGLDGRNRVRAFSLTGQLLGDFLTTETTFEGDLRYAERFILIAIESATGNHTTLKLIDSKL